MKRVEAVRKIPTASSKRTHDESSPKRPRAFTSRTCRKRHYLADSQGLVRAAQLHSDGLHAPSTLVSDLVFAVPRRHALSFRRTVLRDAHGVGAAGLRTAEIATTATRPSSFTTTTPGRVRDGQAARGGGSGGAGGAGRAQGISRTARRWPTSTTRWRCRELSSRPTPTSTARWTAVTAPQPFPSDRHRVEYLFALYEKLAPSVEAPKAMAVSPSVPSRSPLR